MVSSWASHHWSQLYEPGSTSSFQSISLSICLVCTSISLLMRMLPETLPKPYWSQDKQYPLFSTYSLNWSFHHRRLSDTYQHHLCCSSRPISSQQTPHPLKRQSSTNSYGVLEKKKKKKISQHLAPFAIPACPYWRAYNQSSQHSSHVSCPTTCLVSTRLHPCSFTQTSDFSCLCPVFSTTSSKLSEIQMKYSTYVCVEWNFVLATF